MLPLPPAGEGTFRLRGARLLPLPLGEGWGEGFSIRAPLTLSLSAKGERDRGCLINRGGAPNVGLMTRQRSGPRRPCGARRFSVIGAP